MSDEIWSIVQRCWGHQPELRPSFDDILAELLRLAPIDVQTDEDDLGNILDDNSVAQE